MLAKQACRSDAVHERAPHLTAHVSPFVLDDGVRDPAQSVPGVAQAPCEIDVRAECERLVKAIDCVERLTSKCDVDRRSCGDVAFGSIAPPVGYPNRCSDPAIQPDRR